MPNPFLRYSLDERWPLILGRLREGMCIPFLGAGASLGSNAAPGLPSGSDIARRLAKGCDYPGSDHGDLLRVAQYFEFKHDPHEVRARVRRLLSVPGVNPGLVHRTIAALPITCVLTTNFDDLMERAFREVGKEPVVAVYRRRQNAESIAEPSEEKPLVYKLHGSLEDLYSMVITEDDIVDFLACLMLNDPPLPKLIKAYFEHRSILFVGYGLKDWNVRVMLRAIRGHRTGAGPGLASFAIQKRPDDDRLAQEWEESVMFLQSRERLECYDMDAVDFATELKRRYDAGEGRFE